MLATTTVTTPRRKFNRFIVKDSNVILNINDDVLKQIRFLNSKNKNTEWSGVLFYEIVSGTLNDPSKITFEAKYIYLMDIGTAARTDYSFKGSGGPEITEFLYKMAENLGLDEEYIFTKWKMGHIHSHHNGFVNPSPTDYEEIEDNVVNYPAYLTVISNNSMEMSGNLNVFYQTTAKLDLLAETYEGEKIVLTDEEFSDRIYHYPIEIKASIPEIEDKFVKRYNEVEEKKKIIIQPKAIAGNIYHNQQINHYKNSYYENEAAYKEFRSEVDTLFDGVNTLSPDEEFEETITVELITSYIFSNEDRNKIVTVYEALERVNNDTKDKKYKKEIFDKIIQNIPSIVYLYVENENPTKEQIKEQISNTLNVLTKYRTSNPTTNNVCNELINLFRKYDSK